MEIVNNRLKGNELTKEDWTEQLPDKVFAMIAFSCDWRITYEERIDGIFYSGLLLREVTRGYERIGAFMNQDRDGWINL